MQCVLRFSLSCTGPVRFTFQHYCAGQPTSRFFSNQLDRRSVFRATRLLLWDVFQQDLAVYVYLPLLRLAVGQPVYISVWVRSHCDIRYMNPMASQNQ